MHITQLWGQMSSYKHVCAHVGNGNAFLLHPISEEEKSEKICTLQSLVYSNTFLRVLFKGDWIVFFLVSWAFSRSTDYRQWWGNLERFKGNNELAIRALWRFILSGDLRGPDSVTARLLQWGDFCMQQLITWLWCMCKITKQPESRAYVGVTLVAPSPHRYPRTG